MAQTAVDPLNPGPAPNGRGPRARAGAPPLAEVATTSSQDLFASFIADGNLIFTGPSGTGIYLNPDKVALEEGGDSGVGIYEEMLQKDAHLAGVWETRLNAVLGLPTTIKPASDDPDHLRHAEYAQSIVGAIPKIKDAKRRALFSVFQGYSVTEVLYAIRDDGTVGVRDLKTRDPRRFVFDLDWKPRLRRLSSWLAGEELPERKFLVSRYNPKDGNPYGVGIGQSLFWPYFFKKNALKFWIIFAEKFGMPTVWAKHPVGLPEPERQKLLGHIASLQRESAIATSDTITLELLEAARASSVSTYEDFCRFLNDEMSKRVLGQTLSTDAHSVGLGGGRTPQGHAQVRQDILESDAGEQDEWMNELIEWLVTWQFGPQEAYPCHETNAAPPEDLKSLAERDLILVDMGVPVPVSYARDRYGIPAPEVDADGAEEPMLAPRAPAAPPPGPAGAPNEPGKPPAQFGERGLPPVDPRSDPEIEAVLGTGQGALATAFLALQREIMATVTDPGKRSRTR